MVKQDLRGRVEGDRQEGQDSLADLLAIPAFGPLTLTQKSLHFVVAPRFAFVLIVREWRQLHVLLCPLYGRPRGGLGVFVPELDVMTSMNSSGRLLNESIHHG